MQTTLEPHADGEEEPRKGDAETYHDRLRRFIAATVKERGPIRAVPFLARQYFEAVERGNPATVKIFLDAGMNVNYPDARSGQTALHIAAAARARDIVRLLLTTGRCDYLIRDNQGRLPSELAYTIAEDPALARLLGNKERKQAAAQGVTLTHRPRPSMH